MLLEIFTGKNPTHESFSGSLNLTKWVWSSFPANVVQVLYPELLLLMSSLYHDGQPISPDLQYSCLITILGVGLSCTEESCYGRITIRSALQKLESARDTLFKPAAPIMDSIRIWTIWRKMKKEIKNRDKKTEIEKKYSGEKMISCITQWTGWIKCITSSIFINWYNQ